MYGKKWSWKTTLGGLGSILSGLGMIAAAAATGHIADPTVLVPAFGLISTGIGNIYARDNNVTSEQAGAK